ncbi:MAG: polysaccharide biosynthesis/export family protein [Victivallaceae bacterium]|nr:polysaccharide biosynthesis/export family protein [Victivallaceae bacterium]
MTTKLKNSLTLLIAAGAILLAGGCTEIFAPVSIPAETMILPTDNKQTEVDRTDQLKALQKPTPEDYRITAEDRFTVTVYEHPELEIKNTVITPDGYISLPLAGPVRVGAMTIPEATAALTEAFKKYLRNPIVSMVPEQIHGYTFTIIGKINKAGRYNIAGITRLTDAIAMAGGLSVGMFNGDTSELADLDNAMLVRNGEVLPVNFAKALEQGDTLHNIPLVNGDYIYIPSQMGTMVFVIGEVSGATYVGFKEGMTLVKAVIYAHGITNEHSAYVNVIRGGLVHPVLYRVNIDNILNGRTMDFPLQANDIIYLPKHGLASWNVIVRQIVPTLQGLNMLAGPFGSPSGYFNAD